MATIHPTAIIDAQATLADDVDVGPYSVIGPNVEIGSGTRLMSHVVVDGHTQIGDGCTLFPFCSIGQQTQDLKFKGGKTYVQIGNATTIREYVTINAATNDGDTTRVGSHCHIMAYAHIAHDCQVGDGVILANCGTLAGHVIVEDQVILGGLSAVHQFVRLGRLSIIGGCSKVTQDVPPYMMADGNPLRVHAINSIGLKRKGVHLEAQKKIKQAFRILYRTGLTTRIARERIQAEVPETPEITQLIEFLERSERGITKAAD